MARRLVLASLLLATDAGAADAGSAVVPEPGTALLVLLGVAGLVLGRRRFQRAFRTLFAHRDARG